MAGWCAAITIQECIDSGFGEPAMNPRLARPDAGAQARGGELPKTQKAENKAFNRVRIPTERSNAR